ncbi:MAG TPA: rhodanese-like domain-containing protein, partial [Gemmatimonadales bacterium]|nr:rhodanese-like domain-containing protein [Gemmatimonadales bacterium]
GKQLTQEYPHAEVTGKGLDAHHFKVPTTVLSGVQQSLGKPGMRLVDARPADQYGGSAGAQRRRGHIPGAINHPWKDDLEQRDLSLVWKSVDSLRADYAARGITPDQDLILYCNSSTEASHVFFALKYLLGYPKVRIYTGAWSEWAERMELPIE